MSSETKEAIFAAMGIFMSFLGFKMYKMREEAKNMQFEWERQDAALKPFGFQIDDVMDISKITGLENDYIYKHLMRFGLVGVAPELAKKWFIVCWKSTFRRPPDVEEHLSNWLYTLCHCVSRGYVDKYFWLEMCERSPFTYKILKDNFGGNMQMKNAIKVIDEYINLLETKLQ